MDRFSWSDGVRAVFGSCLPCFKGRPSDSQYNDDGTQRVRRARVDELEGLLADVDTDTEADTMSLHSNIGSGDANARRKKKGGPKKHVRLWGWDLFGRPPVQLPESDEEADYIIRRQRKRPGTISSSTLDSDASPLDPSTIERLSSPPHSNFSQGLTDAQLAAQEEAQRLLEERRERKRDRKEMKRAAKALALGLDEQEFEGFQGSGSNAPSYPHQRMPFVPSLPGDDEFGGFVDVDAADAEADEELDFGAESYTRRKPGGGSNGSDSRSRTSPSQQSSAAYNHHYISAPQVPSSPSGVPLPSSPSPLSEEPRRQKKKRSAGSKKSKSSSSTSQSFSLPSPVQSTFPHRDLDVVVANSDEFAASKHSNNNSGFPSVGFGGERRKGGEMGAAFLARRGNQP